MNKTEYFLGVDIGNLPQELREKAIRASDSLKRFKKAEHQCEAWMKARQLAQGSHAAAMEEYSEVLNRWDPETNTLKALEDAPDGKMNDPQT